MQSWSENFGLGRFSAVLAQKPRVAGKTEAHGLQGIFRGHIAGWGWDQQQNKALSSRPATSPLRHCRDTRDREPKRWSDGVPGQHGVFSWSRREVWAHTGPCQSEASTPPSISLDRASTSAVAHRPEAGSTAPGRGQGAGERPYHHHSRPLAKRGSSFSWKAWYLQLFSM